MLPMNIHANPFCAINTAAIIVIIKKYKKGTAELPVCEHSTQGDLPVNCDNNIQLMSWKYQSFESQKGINAVQTMLHWEPEGG